MNLLFWTSFKFIFNKLVALFFFSLLLLIPLLLIIFFNKTLSDWKRYDVNLLDNIFFNNVKINFLSQLFINVNLLLIKEFVQKQLGSFIELILVLQRYKMALQVCLASNLRPLKLAGQVLPYLLKRGLINRKLIEILP